MSLLQCDEGGPQVTATKVEVAGGPVFSLHPAMKPKITDGKAKPRPVMFCGLAAKDIAAWQPDSLTFNEQVGFRAGTASSISLGLLHLLLTALHMLLAQWWRWLYCWQDTCLELCWRFHCFPHVFAACAFCIVMIAAIIASGAHEWPYRLGAVTGQQRQVPVQLRLQLPSPVGPGVCCAQGG